MLALVDIEVAAGAHRTEVATSAASTLRARKQW